MPLSKKRDKARKRIERALDVVQPSSNLNPVQPTGSMDGLIMEGNRIVGLASPVKPKMEIGHLPFVVHPSMYKELVERYPAIAEEFAPDGNEIDADGNVIYED